VQPQPFGRRDYTDVMQAAAEKFLEKDGSCERGDDVVMVAGIPPNQQASTNLMKIHVIGERDRGVRSQKTSRDSPEVGVFQHLPAGAPPPGRYDQRSTEEFTDTWARPSRSRASSRSTGC
ncbi:MAG: hypothetical protein R3324_12855, partial [Halobacteriales archaeon]|nr:hypothetical protein [Halobacteriales archaeon]